MNFYKRYLGDYARDTAHLSLMEHGAYTILLDTYYATERSLPASKQELYRIAKAFTGAERKAVDRVVEQFFYVNGDGTRHNKRADQEIGKRGEQADTNRRIAEERERRRRQHESSDDTHNDQHDETSTNRATNDQPNHSQSQKETPREPDGSLSAPGVPDCPQRELLALYAKHLPMLTQPRLWEGTRAKLLRDRWRHCSKPNGVWPGYRTAEDGIAFWDQFFSGVAAAAKLTEGIPQRDGSRWKPDLPWLLKAENFAKVIEGKYHQ